MRSEERDVAVCALEFSSVAFVGGQRKTLISFIWFGREGEFEFLTYPMGAVRLVARGGHHARFVYVDGCLLTFVRFEGRSRSF